MTDRPILFSGPMVRALLEGRKTQTRRVFDLDGPGRIGPRGNDLPVSCLHVQGESVPRVTVGKVVTLIKLKAAVGDRLWVREAWRCNGWATDVATIFYRASEGDSYTAMCEQYPVDGKTYLRPTASWRPSIHMPRWISRLTLVVDGVKVERLQDISEADAIAEGAEQYSSSMKLSRPFNPDWKGIYREGYAELWNAINGPGSWEANPWVAAYTFHVIRSNIDQIGGVE